MTEREIAERLADRMYVYKRNGDHIYEIGSGSTCSDLDEWEASKRWSREEFIDEIVAVLKAAALEHSKPAEEGR